MKKQYYWSKTEDDILLSKGEASTTEELMLLLPDRSRQAIKARLGRLGIIRNNWAIPEIFTNRTDIPSEIEKAYLAGHFDGEGCIRLRRSGKSVKIEIFVQAAYRPTLECYLKFFQGSLYSCQGTNKPLYRWHLTGYHKALVFIKDLLPYSSEKRPQLEVAKEYIEKRIIASKTQPSEDIRQLGIECMHKLISLKKV